MRMPNIIWRDERIPVMVLGTAQLGIPGYGIGNGAGALTQAEANCLIAEAWNAGGRFFDTAQGYGDSEHKLGHAFRELELAGSEPKLVTKLDPGLSPEDHGGIQDSLEDSFTKLGVSMLWGIMLHRYTWLECWHTGLGRILKEFRQSGRMKYIGISVYEPEEAIASLLNEDIDFVQIPANAWDSRMERAGVFSLARRQGKLLFIRSIFLQGLLLMDPEVAEQRVPGSFSLAKQWDAIAHNLGKSKLSVALSWGMKIGAPLVLGAESPSQVSELAETLANEAAAMDFTSHDIMSGLAVYEDPFILDPRKWRPA